MKIGARAILGVVMLLLNQTFASAANMPTTSPPAIPLVPAVGSTFKAVPAPIPHIAFVGSDGPFVGIALETAVSMVLAHNPDLQIAESNRRIAGFQAIADRGPYDLQLNLSPTFTDEKLPAISPFQSGPGGGPSTTLTSGVASGLSITTLGGTNVRLSASALRTTSDSTANAYNPFYSTALAFNVDQPFGRGRFTKDRRDLVLAVISTHVQSAQALVLASTTITETVDTYWDLVAAWRSLGIQEETVRQARAQSASNQRLVSRGAAAPVDIVEADTQVDLDQDNVFAGVQAVAALENRLKGLILGNPADPLWQANFVPTTPVNVAPPEPQLRNLIISALLHRPEFRLVAAAQISAQTQIAYARDEGRPKLDLRLGIRKSGFAGQSGNLSQNPIFMSLAPITPLAFANTSATTGRLGTAWSSLFANDYPSYTADFSLGLPLHDDRARGDLAVGHEQERQAGLQESLYIQRLIIEARNAIQSFDTGQQRLLSAHAARIAADRVLQGEERRFVMGRSTTFLVLQREIVAATTQGRELQAQTDLNKSIAELDRVSGTLFAKHGVQVEDTPHALVLLRLREAGMAIDAADLAGALKSR